VSTSDELTRAYLESLPIEKGTPFLFRGLATEADGRAIYDAFFDLIPEVTRLDDVDDSDSGSLPEGVPPVADETSSDAHEQVENPFLLQHVRHVVFTDDMPGTARHWQRELGSPETGATADEDGAAFGKVFHWMDATGRWHGIATFHVSVGYGLLNKDPVALTLMTHELTHLRFCAELHDKLGQEPRGDGWPDLRRFFVWGCLDEAIAEAHARAYMTEEFRTDQDGYLVTLARKGLHATREAVAEYRHHGDVGRVWNETVTAIAPYLTHLGRIVGCYNDTELPEVLRTSLDVVRPGLAIQAVRMLDALKPIFSGAQPMGWAALGDALLAVDLAFDAVGVVPYMEGSAFGIDVPDWPGDRERFYREWAFGRKKRE
jgi:hypothetical protein